MQGSPVQNACNHRANFVRFSVLVFSFSRWANGYITPPACVSVVWAVTATDLCQSKVSLTGGAFCYLSTL
jgi:hypothetical protein